MLTQLNPPLPVHVMDRGKGQALALIDYGPDHHLIWVTALDANGEIWCAPNPQVRLQSNWTMGRKVAVPGSVSQSTTDASAQPCTCQGHRLQPEPLTC